MIVERQLSSPIGMVQPAGRLERERWGHLSTIQNLLPHPLGHGCEPFYYLHHRSAGPANLPGQAHLVVVDRHQGDDDADYDRHKVIH